MTLAATVGPAPTGAHRTATSSSAALPQIPHDEVARNRLLPTSSASGARNLTVTTL